MNVYVRLCKNREGTVITPRLFIKASKGHVKGLPTTAAAHTANPYSMHDIRKKVLLQLKRRLMFLW